jgi:hypothetical protein
MFVLACLYEKEFDFLPPLIPQSLLYIDIVVVIVVVVVIIIIIIIIRGQILVFEFGSQTRCFGLQVKESRNGVVSCLSMALASVWRVFLMFYCLS